MILVKSLITTYIVLFYSVKSQLNPHKFNIYNSKSLCGLDFNIISAVKSLNKVPTDNVAIFADKEFFTLLIHVDLLTVLSGYRPIVWMTLPVDYKYENNLVRNRSPIQNGKQIIFNQSYTIVFLIKDTEYLSAIANISAINPNIIKLVFTFYECFLNDIDSKYEMNIGQLAKDQWVLFRSFNLFFVPMCITDELFKIESKSNDQDVCLVKSIYKYEIVHGDKVNSDSTITNSGNIVNLNVSDATLNKTFLVDVQQNINLKGVKLNIAFYEATSVYLKNKSQHYAKRSQFANIHYDKLPLHKLTIDYFYGTVPMIVKEISHTMNFTPVFIQAKDKIPYGYKVKRNL